MTAFAPASRVPGQMQSDCSEVPNGREQESSGGTSMCTHHFESLEVRRLFAVHAAFFPGVGLLSITGNGNGDTIVVSRDAAGNLLVNGGAVNVKGGASTVANTSLIQISGKNGNDTLALDETNGPLPRAFIFGGA